MRVDPAIAALRSDHAPQRQAQTAIKQACDAWQAEPSVASFLAAFEKFGAGAALENCLALEQVFMEDTGDDGLIHSLTRHLCAAISENPLAHPPFRNGYDGRSSTMLLAKSGRAQLLLQAREPGEYEYPCVTFSDAIRFDATLAGKARANLLRTSGPLEKVHLAHEQIDLRGGVRLALDCSTESMLVTQVERRLVTLRLVQNTSTPQPGREYCIETGKLLHQSAGSRAASRREMMVALLGRMERAEAAPVLAAMVSSESDTSLRWQSLRECLALDTAQGFSALCQIARSAEDALAPSAGALRAQLLEAHPQLSQLENA